MQMIDTRAGNDITRTPWEHPLQHRSPPHLLFGSRKKATSTLTPSSYVSSSNGNSWGVSFWKAIKRLSDKPAALTFHFDFSLMLKKKKNLPSTHLESTDFVLQRFSVHSCDFVHWPITGFLKCFCKLYEVLQYKCEINFSNQVSLDTFPSG